MRFEPSGANQTIASRPLDEGQLQFPWVFRVDAQDRLAVGLNLVGTELTWCASQASLGAGEHDVSFELTGQQVLLTLDSVEVARCKVDGALATTGEVLWGQVRHFKSPDDRQAFSGVLRSTFARELAWR